MWCPNCGTKLDDGAKFCPNCGTKVQNDIIKPVSENRMEPESEWDGQVEDENDYSGYADLDLEDDEKKVSKMPLFLQNLLPFPLSFELHPSLCYDAPAYRLRLLQEARQSQSQES